MRVMMIFVGLVLEGMVVDQMTFQQMEWRIIFMDHKLALNLFVACVVFLNQQVVL